MENINKKDFSRIYELMSFDRGKTLYEMEQKWDNLLTETKAPSGSNPKEYVRMDIEKSAKSENITKTWQEIKKEFGSKGDYDDNITLFRAWMDKGWRPGKSIPTGYETDTYKSRTNSASGTTSGSTSGTTSGSTSGATQTVKLKYDANALLYYAMERRKKSMEPGGDLDNSEKYGNLALYFQDVRDGKAQDVTKYKLTQADVDTFISEFEKMIAGNNDLLNKYIENGKNTTVTNIAGRLEFKTKTSSTVPGDVNGDGVVNASDLPPDQKMDNNRTQSGDEDLDYDADEEGFEEEQPEMEKEIDTTRKMEVNKSNNVWADFFGNNL